LQQIDREGSDKENSVLVSPKKASKRKTPLTPLKKEQDPSSSTVFGVCTGDKQYCPVHSLQFTRPKWYFFWDPVQIDSLIEGLTPRGIREKELRQSLIEEKDNLKSIIKKCPVAKLNTEKTYPDIVSSAPARKSKNQSISNFGFSWDTSIDTIMELQLRDLILETEEKVFLGGLGSLKVMFLKIGDHLLTSVFFVLLFITYQLSILSG